MSQGKNNAVLFFLAFFKYSIFFFNSPIEAIPVDNIIGLFVEAIFLISGTLIKSIEETLYPLTFNFSKRLTESISNGVENIKSISSA